MSSPAVTGRGRAQGKAILFGEHAVVYGCPAYAVGLGVGAEASANPASSSTLAVGDQVITVGVDDVPLAHAYRALLVALGAGDFAAHSSLEVPAGCGLGASAALGVAVARAVLAAHEPSVASTEDGGRRSLSAALEWERVFHGNPSGIDTATAALGGCVHYRKSHGAQPWPLGRSLQLVVAVAGPPASTRTMVDRVAALRQSQPARARRAFAAIEALSEAAGEALRAGDRPLLGSLMLDNHRWLRELGVSTPALDQACARALDAGALGAKLTGSGGGGCIVALAPHDPLPLTQALERAGLQALAVSVPGD